MNVETYEIEEVVESPTGTTPELEDEASRLVDQLGLEGQLELVTKNQNTGKDERVPYPKMSDEERAVFGVLFPVVDKVAKYSAGIIPVRVLQVIGHAQGLFDEIQVWHDRVVNPDPILVGKLDNDLFILARWGTETLRPFKVLVEAARDKLRPEWVRRAAEKISEIQGFVAAIESNLTRKLTLRFFYEPF